MFSGLQEAVLKNIDACKELSLLTKSSMGPNGEQSLFQVHTCPVQVRCSHCDRGTVSIPAATSPHSRPCCFHRGVQV
jgi:hypothetical protein